jgi:gliding motility-associated-like protein
MKFYFTCLFSVFLLLQVNASHIVGGDIYYDYLGSNNYRITVVLFRDCASTGAAYDPEMSVGIFDMNNNLVQNVLIPFPGSIVLPVVLNNPCVTPPAGICTERAIYQTTINLPPTLGGYNVTYQRCCRGPNVTNLIVPEDTGLSLTTHITGSTAGNLINSSPRFNNYPPLVICNNDILNFDHSALDPDGDELVYSLVTPFAGASDVSPAPNPPPSPPYTPVNWGGGFQAANPLGPGASISIDPVTGELTADPEMIGLFVVGIKVSEYRNGVFVGESIRDFLFKVVNCVIQLQANVVPQVEASNFVSYCQGYDAVFENTSFGGSNYLWDFGVDAIDTDVSTDFTPTYTFPGPGEYEVTLVVNPGWPCTDTSKQMFIILENLDISFLVADSICISGNSFNFDGVYDGPANPLFSWNFGPFANQATSSFLDVNNVTFSVSGNLPVTLNVDVGFCTGTYTDYVFIYNEPEVNFGITPELQCAPYSAQFYDSSISNAQLIYNWDFGDGGTSNLKNPKHIYENPGVYDVSLSIQSNIGCLAALSLTKDNLITVSPSPISDFYITPLIQDVFDPNFQVFDESFDSPYISYHYNDSIYIYERNPRLNFIESGGYLIYQIVENQFGCRDSSHFLIKVLPISTVFIPNTFTPDGNKFNNTFRPVVFDVLNYELKIYNRWGELLFETKDSKASWDGTYKSKFCPDGLYTYTLQYNDIQTDELILKQGHVNLLR